LGTPTNLSQILDRQLDNLLLRYRNVDFLPCNDLLHRISSAGKKMHTILKFPAVRSINRKAGGIAQLRL
jgi:hypothetical protein